MNELSKNIRQSWEKLNENMEWKLEYIKINLNFVKSKKIIETKQSCLEAGWKQKEYMTSEPEKKE